MLNAKTGQQQTEELDFCATEMARYPKGYRASRASRGRARSARAPRTPTAAVGSDTDMPYGDAANDTRNGTPQDEVEDAETPAQESVADEEDPSSPPAIQAFPRRRGRGSRRSAAVRVDFDTPERADEASEGGTPQRRKRGRPYGFGGRGGFRGRRRGQEPNPTPRIVIDGEAVDVLDDEVQVSEDEEGEERVDKRGHLQGGREYRVRTFTIQGKDERLYMLSTEPARCTGYRDSYLFFNKHPKLHKVIVGEEAKKDLISREILPHSYKGRNIGVVTARSVFREFGAKIVVGGRKVIDDYYVTNARANGDVEGELTDPKDRVPDKGEDYNRNQYVAWFGASNVYHSVVPQGAPKPGISGKRRNNVTVGNWQFMHAREASRFNTALTAFRHANLNGVYDTHTNQMFYPKIMQPSHARWEQIPSPPENAEKPSVNALTNGTAHLANGNTSGAEDDVMDVDELPRPNLHQEAQPTIFSDIPPSISRNFVVIDTVYSTPPICNTGLPGVDGHIHDLGPNGLDTVSADLIDELPDEYKTAFYDAKKIEMRWKEQWSTEATDGKRGDLRIGFNGYPV